jgi:ubiquinone/menaquinone biosynthesis C-methylase UbiE
MTRFLKNALRNLARLSPLAQSDMPGPKYWKKRAKRYGRRAVLNIAHKDEEYERVTHNQKVAFFPYLRKMLKGDERTVLDVGCGTGRFSVDLARLVGGDCIGVDPVPELLDMAPRSQRVEYLLLKDGEIPLPDRSVDLVWTCLVLHCITTPQELEKVAGEIRRVLRDDGLLFLIENTTDLPDVPYCKYRPPEFYQVLFDFVHLEHLADYTDVGERYSIMAGRKVRQAAHVAPAVLLHSGHLS